MTLREGLTWLTGVGAGVLAFYLVDRLETQKRWPGLAHWLGFLRPDDKRWLTFALTGVVAIIGYGLMLVMLYRAVPGNWRTWVEELFTTVAVAIVASQVAHGRVRLRRKPGQGYV